MKEEQKLMKLELQNENQKLESIQLSGLKLYFFNFVYHLLETQMENILLDYLLIIIQFIQLISFPMDYAFSDGWKNSWFGTVGHFFHYCQTLFILVDYSNFFLISFFFSVLYIIVFFILLSLSIHNLAKHSLNKNILEITYILIQFNTILSIPFLKILFNIFVCNENNNLYNENIKCNSNLHLAMIVISCISIVIYVPLLYLLKSVYFEYGVVQNKIKSCFTSSTEVVLILIKLILVVVYRFITHEIALSIITLVLSFYIFFDYYGKQPYTNKYFNKTYLTLYLLFLWSSFICFVALILKNSKFEGAIFILLLGYPIIILTLIIREFEFTFEKLFEFNEDKYKDGYKSLVKIEYFLKLEQALSDKIRTREQKILYSYIENYEQTCTNEECELKSFLKIPLKVENFENMKICLLMHAELLFKEEISKYPFNAKLRLSYAIFLYYKMNKKQLGTKEILLLSKHSSNFEDTFLIYRAQKLIEAENSGVSFNAITQKEIGKLNFKAIINNLRTIMGKIVMNYIDFWSILARSDELKSENFKKMNEIGNKINKLNGDLNTNIEKLEKVNLYDRELIRLYLQYLIEILNDHSTADKYNSKIIELEHAKHQYDEDNIFNLNLKAMTRSEDYKYLVVSLYPENFGLICNMSLSANILFGFTKEELIGRPLDYILPELFIIPHKKLLSDSTEKFRKSNILKNTTASKIRSDFKNIETFGRNKMKYLIPVKMKNVLVSTEEGKIYGVSKIVEENNLMNDKQPEIAYVLTDNDFIINSFSPNATKLLHLHSYLLNLNLDITNYISELRKDIYFYEEKAEIKRMKKSDIMENKSFSESMRNTIQIKTSLITKSYVREKEKNEKKLITWNIFDIYGKAPKAKRLSRHIRSDLREEFYNYSKGLEEEEKENCESNNSKNQTENCGNKDFTAQFYLTLNDIKIGGNKIGYIFKFETVIKNTNQNYSICNSTMHPIKNTKIIKGSDIERLDSSEISFIPGNTGKKSEQKIIFNKTEENPNGIDLGIDITFIPKLFKENYFYLDTERMSYKQIKNFDKNKNYKIADIILRKQAEDKILNLKQKESNEEEESEGSSSYIYSSNEEELEENSKTSSFISSINEKNEERKSKLGNLNIQEVTPCPRKSITMESMNNLTENPNQNLKSSNIKQLTNLNSIQGRKSSYTNNDFYNINTEHITLFVYNYSTGFVEAIKDPKFKISQVTSQIQMNKERIEKSNAKYIANPKLAHKEKKKILINSLKKSELSENEIISISEKKIKLLEINNALSSKERQSSVVNLCIFSFIVFILVIGSSGASLLYNILMEKNIFNYYSLMEKSVSLNKDILFEIFFVREIVFTSNPDYNKTYQENKDSYFLNFSSTCTEYYLYTSSILSSLLTLIENLDEKEKNKIMKKSGIVTIIDKILSSNENYLFKDYELLIYSGFHEINAALYHISQMKLEEVNEYEENIFYFLRNSFNFALIMINDQIEIIIDGFYSEIKTEKYYLIICIFVMIIIYILNYIMFIFFYSKVENIKQNYLSIFDDIGKEYVFHSLSKCEKFSQKIHLKDEANAKENNSNNSSIKDEENLDINELSSIKSMKKDKEVKVINSSRKEKKIVSHSKEKIIGLFIFLILLIVQLFSYFYYFTRLNLYKNCVQYKYYNNIYNSYFLIPFLSMREYLTASNNYIMEQNINEYLDNALEKNYMNLKDISKNLEKYKKYLPNSYNNYLDDLYNNQQCKLLADFINEYNLSSYKTCDSIFYNLSSYGFDSLSMSFFEDIRNIKYLANNVYKDNKLNIYEKKRRLIDIMNNEKYKMNVIIFRFVIMKLIDKSLYKLNEAIKSNFDETMKISLIINIIFIIFIFIVFIIFWLPFVFEENETIYKTKNMLCIIPKDVLLDLPNINTKLGIDGEN